MNTRSRSRVSTSRTDGGTSTAETTNGAVSRGTGVTSRPSSSASSNASGTSRSTEKVAEVARFRFERTRQLMKTERKLVRSCEHVILLNDKIRGLTKRYQQARAEGFKSFRYNLRIRLAAVEGVRNMFYEYARDRAEEVAELRKELYDQNVQIVTGSEPEESEDEYEISDDQSEADEEDMEADDVDDE